MPEIEVREVPIAQERHRTRNGRPYTPTATLEMQRRIRLAWQTAGHGVIRGPVVLEVWAYFPRPAGHYGTGRNAGRVKPSAPAVPDGERNDWDNLGKLVSDALRHEAMEGDGKVVDGIVHQRFADDRPPGWRVRVDPWQEDTEYGTASVRSHAYPRTSDREAAAGPARW